MLTRASLPVAGTNLIAYAMVLGNNLSVGRLGTLELGSVSIANLTSWVSGAAASLHRWPLLSLAGVMVLRAAGYALDTLSTQAYTANPKSCGTLAMRTGVIMLGILPFQIAFAWHSEAFFLAVGQEPEVAHLAARYMSRLSLSLPGYGLFEVQRCWLQSQGLMHIPTMVTCTVAPLSLIMSWFLVHVRPPALDFRL